MQVSYLCIFQQSTNTETPLTDFEKSNVTKLNHIVDDVQVQVVDVKDLSLSSITS